MTYFPWQLYQDNMFTIQNAEYCVQSFIVQTMDLHLNLCSLNINSLLFFHLMKHFLLYVVNWEL